MSFNKVILSLAGVDVLVQSSCGKFTKCVICQSLFTTGNGTSIIHHTGDKDHKQLLVDKLRQVKAMLHEKSLNTLLQSDGSTLAQTNSVTCAKCSICKCNLPGNGHEIFRHLDGKKHKARLYKTFRGKKIKDRPSKKFGRYVCVRGFDPSPNLGRKLRNCFKCMGFKVKGVYIDPGTASYAIIKMRENDCRNAVQQCTNVFLCGKKLIITQYDATTIDTPHNSHPSSFVIPQNSHMKDLLLVFPETTIEDVIDPDYIPLPPKLKIDIALKSNIEDQMKLLRDFYVLTAEELLQRNLACQMLKDRLEQTFTQCSVILLGSSVNGLGEGSENFDVTLVYNDETLDYTMLENVLRGFPSVFKNISVTKITKLYTVLKFYHSESCHYVDFSINNFLAISNSELLMTYMNFDRRVLLLTFTIRKWAKCFGLIGCNNYQISQYALTVMIIYFLQQIQPPVLPCLQKCHPSEKVLFRNWDCSYCKCEKKMYPENIMQTGNLLCSFFKFYSGFDFYNHVIAINCDTILTRNEICTNVNSLQLGDAWRDFMFNSPLVVQDPFELVHNITHTLSIQGMRLWLNSFSQAYVALHVSKASLLPLFTKVK